VTLRRRKWHVYAKPPFGGPEAVLAYLSRYTHRVAISNSRLIAFDRKGVTFKYKDYRADGSARYKRMTLTPHEFIRRFLIHVLPKGFHRIRHFGLFAKSSCTNNIARARELLAVCQAEAQVGHHDSDAFRRIRLTLGGSRMGAQDQSTNRYRQTYRSNFEHSSSFPMRLSSPTKKLQFV